MRARYELIAKADLANLAADLLADLRASAAPHRALILLDGPMGSGKTTFTQVLVNALGSPETASPSFAIHHSYSAPEFAIEHFDLFRLESIDDLESTGFWDVFRAKQAIVIIEWSEKLENFGLSGSLPLSWPTWRLRFDFPSGDSASSERRVVTTESPKTRPVSHGF